jgi:hypothetical protein
VSALLRDAGLTDVRVLIAPGIRRRFGGASIRTLGDAREGHDDQRPGNRRRPSGHEERGPAGEEGRRSAVPQELAKER